MKRAAIFVFYEKEGIVGRYVEYLLKDLLQNVSDLYIVSNVKLEKEEKDKLYVFTDKVYERENKGYDGTAYKDILCNIIGFSNLERWDELLLINDTFYGPFYPFSCIFEQMEKRVCDFWGLTLHGERKSVQPIVEHIQSYFMVIRSGMLHSEKFTEFWNKMGTIHSFEDAVNNFEIEFTGFFSQHGVTYDVWMDTASLEKGYSGNAVNFTHYMANELIVNNDFPILKRKALTESDAALVEPLETIRYIDRHLSYDVSMIWEDILQRYNIRNLIFKMHLLYVINDLDKEGEQSDLFQNIILFRLNDYCTLENNKKWIIEISEIIKIGFLLENVELVKNINENFESSCMYIINNQTEEVDIWKELADKYICVGYINLEHLKCCSYEKTKMITDRIRCSLIINPGYIYQISNLMLNEKSLGMVFPPPDRYEFQNDYIWGEDAFWMKGECLQKLCNTDIDADWLPEKLRKIGYYSSIAEPASYARKELADFYYNSKKKVFQTPDFYLEEFWFKYDKRYIYGTGKIADKVTEYFMLKGWDEFEGYIVTKRKEGLQEYYGKKVWQLDEISECETGIILAVNNINLKAIIPLLNKRKGIHYFVIRGIEMEGDTRD